MNFKNLKYLDSLALWKGSGDYSRDSICKVMGVLGNPQNRVRTCLIGGTNGKGSVSTALASIAYASGLKVGLVSSPHLSRVNERFSVNGRCIEDDCLDELIGSVREVVNELGVELSYFELAVAASFLGLQRLKCDLGVIEVGLGGMRDATNIIEKPAVSAVVSVSLDHQAVLGDTLSEIAFDKARICREGCDLVLGGVCQEAFAAVESVVSEVGARLLTLGRDFAVSEIGEGGCVFESSEHSLRFTPSLAGSHQIENAAVALQVASSLGINRDFWQTGLSRMALPARLERRAYRDLKEVIIDSAHNPAGMRALREYIEREDLSGITMGIGLLDGPNWKELVDLIYPVVGKLCFVSPPTPRALDEKSIRDYVSCLDVRTEFFGDDIDAFLDKYLRGGGDERILLAGSMYLIGELRHQLFGPVEGTYS